MGRGRQAARCASRSHTHTHKRVTPPPPSLRRARVCIVSSLTLLLLSLPLTWIQCLQATPAAVLAALLNCRLYFSWRRFCARRR